MPSYKMIQTVLEDKTYQITIRSSDADIFKWIVEEVRSKIGSCETRDESYDLAGQLFSCDLHKLKGKDGAAYLFILRRLSETGWEPYQVHGWSYWFRKSMADV